jgi:uncharacterized membrane protein
MQKFSIEKALRFGWDTVQKNLVFLVGVVLFMALISYFPLIIEMYARERVGGYLILFRIVSSFLQVVMSMGLIRISLRFVDNQEADTKDLFSCFHLFFRYLIASIIFAVFVLLGLVLLIIPGIILALKFQFYDYFIIDKELGIMESIERSGKITEGALWELFLFTLVLFGINILGALCFIVGLLVTIPISMVAMAHVYRQLQTRFDSQI